MNLKADYALYFDVNMTITYSITLLNKINK